MTSAKLLRRLAERGPVVFTQFPLKSNRCILATAAGLDVLHTYGVEARAVSLKLDLINKAYLSITSEMSEADVVASGAWRLSTGDPRPVVSDEPFQSRGDYNGHVAIDLPKLGKLLDLDFQQLARPAKAIQVPPALLVDSGTRPR